MGQNIKGIKIEIGAETTQFNKALKSMKAESNSVQNELNAVNKALKFDPKNVDLIKQKEELLGKQVENTKVKIEKLRAAKDKADKEMANGTEVNQEQYRILVREISAAEGQLKSLIKQSDKFGNSAKELGGSLESIGTKGMAVSGAIIGIGTAAVGAMSAAAEETREYREDMNKLETAFKSGGFTLDAAKKSYEDFFVLLGESDRSVEAVNHLAELTNNEKELAQWSNIAAGVTAKFGDSLPIEGLTEAANETAKVAKVTGPLADALNWVSAESNVFSEALGGNDKALKAFNKAIKDGEMVEDAFSAALAEMSTEQERSTAITNILNGIYEESGTIYKELNADIIANRRETSKANDQMAELGESSEGVNTALKKAKNTISAAILPTIGNLAEKIGDLDENQIKVIAGIGAATVAIPALITGTGKMITAIGAISTAYKTMTASATAASIASKAIPYVAVAAGAIALVAAISKVATATDAETKKANELHEAQMRRYEDYQKNKQAAQEQAEASLSEISHIEKLKDELMDLADESGRVADSDKARAEFILNQLNEALGTEYTMTDNLINSYSSLSQAIDELITKKRAEILLSSKEDTYKNAVKEIEAVSKAYSESAPAYEKAKKAYEEYEAKVKEMQASGQTITHDMGAELNRLREDLRRKQAAYEEDKELYEQYTSDIADYEKTYISIMEDGGKAIVAEHKDRTTVLTEEQQKAGKAYEDSIVKLADYAEKYKQGVSGYTAAGLEELKTHTLELKTEAEKIGVSINEGMVVGLEDTEEVKGAVSSLCDLIPQWAKDFLGINSPAKVAIPIGEAIPQGVAVGIKKDMSAEEALEQKCKNLENILREYTDRHSVNMKLAESDFEIWKLENPEADDDEIAAKEKEMLNKKLSEQEQAVQDVNDALWYQIQLTGEESDESQKLLLQLKEEKIAYLELADAVARANDEKSGRSGSSGGTGRGKVADYTAYHVQYGAVLKSYGYTQEQVDAAARKVSGYKGEQTVNINYNISGVQADTAYKVVQETEKTANNLAMQGVL